MTYRQAFLILLLFFLFSLLLSEAHRHTFSINSSFPVPSSDLLLIAHYETQNCFLHRFFLERAERQEREKEQQS